MANYRKLLIYCNLWINVSFQFERKSCYRPLKSKGDVNLKVCHGILTPMKNLFLNLRVETWKFCTIKKYQNLTHTNTWLQVLIIDTGTPLNIYTDTNTCLKVLTDTNTNTYTVYFSNVTYTNTCSVVVKHMDIIPTLIWGNLSLIDTKSIKTHTDSDTNTAYQIW